MKAEFGPCLLYSIRWRNIQFSCTVRLMIVRRLNQQLAKIISKTERLNPWWICAFCGQAGGKKTSEETYNTIIFIEQGKIKEQPKHFLWRRSALFHVHFLWEGHSYTFSFFQVCYFESQFLLVTFLSEKNW